MSQPSDPSEQYAAVRVERGVQVMVFPAGVLDGNAVRRMYELGVEHISAPNARLLIDLTGVTRVSSAALGMFVTLRKKCLGNGSQMHVAVPNEEVMAVFTLMRLEIVVPIYDSRDEAFTRFKPAADA